MSESEPKNPAAVFEAYFGPTMFRPWAELLLSRVNIEVGDRVLDLACATGAVARTLAETRSDLTEIQALDASPAMLEVARSASTDAGLAITWSEGLAEELPFEDAQFDLILCQQGLQFFQDRERAASEIHRVLSPGGRLFATVWHGLDAHPFLAALFAAVSGRLDVPLEAVSLPFSMGDAEELRDYVQSGGFDEVEMSAEELTVRFPEPDRLVQLSLVGAAATIPAFAEMTPSERATLGEQVAEDVAPRIREHLDGDFVSFTTTTNLARAGK